MMVRLISEASASLTAQSDTSEIQISADTPLLQVEEHVELANMIKMFAEKPESQLYQNIL